MSDSSDHKESEDEEETVPDMDKRWVIVDNLPELRENKDYMTISKALEEAARQTASRGSKKEPIVYIPHDKKVTKHSEELRIDRCALVQFGTEKDAVTFVRNYRNIPELKVLGNRLKAYTFRDVEKYDRVPDEYSKLTRDDFQNQRNLFWWLQDEENLSFRDQYAVRFTGPEFEETHVYWMDENQVKQGRALCYDAAELKEERRNMTEQEIEWSPNGFYLLTTHYQGVQLWGGPSWSSLAKFEHFHIDRVAWSPNETFLITCNSMPKTHKDEKLPPTIKIWDVLTGDLLISAPQQKIGPAIKLKLPGWWPIFKWSADERYLAKANSTKKMSAKASNLDIVNLFEVRARTEDEIDADEENKNRYQIARSDKLSVDSLFDLDFSPTDNVLAYSSFAQNDDQAKVTLIAIPSRNSLRVQTLGFNVKKAHLYWQTQGRYLAINMAHSQSKNTLVIKEHSIGILTIKDKNMPFSRTDKLGMVTFFAWEPNNSRFVVIHGGSKRFDPCVSVYQVQDTVTSPSSGASDKGATRLKLTMRERKFNRVLWAPHGGRLVCANIDPEGRVGGELEFVDLSKVKHTADDSATVKGMLHESMTNIEWDPSGRYLVTATTQQLGASSGDDTRYTVWSYQGDQLFMHKLKSFYQISFRPRPKMFERLTQSDRQNVKTSLSKLSSQLEAHDRRIRDATVNKKLLENREQEQRYLKRKQALQSLAKELMRKRGAMRGPVADNFIYRPIQQKLERGPPVQYTITKDVMRKILNEEITDFAKWWNNNR